jgi:hypothetical protein
LKNKAKTGAGRIGAGMFGVVTQSDTLKSHKGVDGACAGI